MLKSQSGVGSALKFALALMGLTATLTTKSGGRPPAWLRQPAFISDWAESRGAGQWALGNDYEIV